MRLAFVPISFFSCTCWAIARGQHQEGVPYCNLHVASWSNFQLWPIFWGFWQLNFCTETASPPFFLLETFYGSHVMTSWWSRDDHVMHMWQSCDYPRRSPAVWDELWLWTDYTGAHHSRLPEPQIPSTAWGVSLDHAPQWTRDSCGTYKNLVSEYLRQTGIKVTSYLC